MTNTIDTMMRNHILGTWAMFTETDLHDLGIHPTTPLLRLQVGPDHLIPAFQFTPDGQVRPGVEKLLQLLPSDPTGWKQAFWLAEPTDDLHPKGFLPVEGHSRNTWSRFHAPAEPIAPIECFPIDPEAVLAHATQQFGAQGDQA
jgi:hypothetical protein